MTLHKFPFYFPFLPPQGTYGAPATISALIKDNFGTACETLVLASQPLVQIQDYINPFAVRWKELERRTANSLCSVRSHHHLPSQVKSKSTYAFHVVWCFFVMNGIQPTKKWKSAFAFYLNSSLNHLTIKSWNKGVLSFPTAETNFWGWWSLGSPKTLVNVFWHEWLEMSMIKHQERDITF